MDIEKLINEITNEVYMKVSSDTAFVQNSSTKLEDIAVDAELVLNDPLINEASVSDMISAALKYHFRSVAVFSSYVRLAADRLSGSDVKVVCMAGFPAGASSTAAKVSEALEAVRNGADVVEVIANVGAMKSEDWKFVHDDMAAVVKALNGRAEIRAIIEAEVLTDEEKIKAASACSLAGVDMIVSSTGCRGKEPKAEDIDILKAVFPTVKAACTSSISEAKNLLDHGSCIVGVRQSILK